MGEAPKFSDSISNCINNIEKSNKLNICKRLSIMKKLTSGESKITYLRHAPSETNHL